MAVKARRASLINKALLWLLLVHAAKVMDKTVVFLCTFWCMAQQEEDVGC